MVIFVHSDSGMVLRASCLTQQSRSRTERSVNEPKWAVIAPNKILGAERLK
jgi:hypothetical protein